MFFVESSVTTHMCPICQATLRYRDSRPRIRRKEGGLKDQLIIRRFYCKNCHSYHNELPDCLVPYKHYETEVISGVLDGVVQPEDLDSEDYPSCATMLRWLQWFCENLEQLLLNRFAVEDETQKLHHIIIGQNGRLSQKSFQHSGTSAKAVGSLASGQSLDFPFQSLFLVLGCGQLFLRNILFVFQLFQFIIGHQLGSFRNNG